MKDKSIVTMSVRVPGEIAERLDKIAGAAGLDRSKLINNILDESSKTLLQCKAIGLLQFTVLIRNMGDSMREWVQGVNDCKIEIKGLELE